LAHVLFFGARKAAISCNYAALLVFASLFFYHHLLSAAKCDTSVNCNQMQI